MFFHDHFIVSFTMSLNLFGKCFVQAPRNLLYKLRLLSLFSCSQPAVHSTSTLASKGLLSHLCNRSNTQPHGQTCGTNTGQVSSRYSTAQFTTAQPHTGAKTGLHSVPITSSGRAVQLKMQTQMTMPGRCTTYSMRMHMSQWS